MFKLKVTDKKDKQSEYTKDLIKRKNIAYKDMKENNTIENVRNFKNLSNISRKAIIYDKRKNFKSTLESNMSNSHKTWKSATDKIYGNKNLIADKMMENNKLVKGSKKVANILNRYFVRKAPNIINNLPNVNINPMDYFKKYIKQQQNKFYIKQINMSELN